MYSNGFCQPYYHDMQAIAYSEGHGISLSQETALSLLRMQREQDQYSGRLAGKPQRLPESNHLTHRQKEGWCQAAGI